MLLVYLIGLVLSTTEDMEAGRKLLRGTTAPFVVKNCLGRSVVRPNIDTFPLVPLVVSLSNHVRPRSSFDMLRTGG
jgi:hypothetical protein